MASPPAQVTFTDLPVEIQEKIINLLSLADATHTLRRLRLTSKHLEFLVAPALLTKLVICTRGLKVTPFSRCQDYEATVLVGRGSVFRGVRTLKLTSLLPRGDPLPWYTMLNTLVPQLKGLQTLWWLHELNSGGQPPQEVEKLAKSFAQLPNLRLLDLRLHDGFRNSCLEFPIKLMGHPNLRRLHLEWCSNQRPTPDTLSQFSSFLTGSPNLEHFSFTLLMGEAIALVMLEAIFQGIAKMPLPLQLKSLQLILPNSTRIEFNRYMRYLRNIKKLEISHDPCPSPHNQVALGKICQVLADEGIFLDHITLDTFSDPTVFDYLASYRGLEHIFLQPPMQPHLGSNMSFLPQLMDRFFCSVLPPHAGTLRRLRIGEDRVTEWSMPLERRYLQSIADCQQLEYICCWIMVRPEDVDTPNASVLLSWLETALQLPRLQQLDCPLLSVKNYDSTEDAPMVTMKVGRFAKEVVRKFKSEFEVHFEVRVDFDTSDRYRLL